MECLSSIYDWSQLEEGDPSSSSTSSLLPSCSCTDMSPAEQEVQRLRAKAEFALLRDRVRKSFVNWLGEPQSRKSTDAPIRMDWQQLESSQLTAYPCYWQHTSALSKIGMTSFLAELSRHHRRLEGTTPEPPASKNKLILVVWNLAAIVQAKLHEWQECATAEQEDAFDGVITVRISDLVPLWMWEADVLRHRPALVDVCDRMLSMELCQYRQHCQQPTKAEKRLLREHQMPYLTPQGLCWRARAPVRVDVVRRSSSAAAVAASSSLSTQSRSRVKVPSPRAKRTGFVSQAPVASARRLARNPEHTSEISSGTTRHRRYHSSRSVHPNRSRGVILVGTYGRHGVNRSSEEDGESNECEEDDIDGDTDAEESSSREESSSDSEATSAEDDECSTMISGVACSSQNKPMSSKRSVVHTKLRHS